MYKVKVRKLGSTITFSDFLFIGMTLDVGKEVKLLNLMRKYLSYIKFLTMLNIGKAHI